MSLNSITQKSNGLTTEQAQQLLRIHGRNELVAGSQFTQFRQFLKILSDPMGLMMLGLSGLYFLTGESTDAIIILIAYIPVTAVDVFLELKSEKALKALKSNLQTSAKILRDGVLKDIPIQLIVPGDVIAFEEGQSLPADGKVIESQNLSINESALTGESLPIEKNREADFFAGTSVLNGRGFGLIKKTGKETKFGKISHLLEETKGQESPLQIKVYALVKKIVILAAGLVILLFWIEYARGSSWLKSLITALTFGMAAVPEEFPLVFTLYLSMGAYRLSKHGVLVKTLPSVETLGNVDVICTDKTGTLTEGRFSLVEVVPFGSLNSDERNLIALLACEPTPVDAMETAIFEKISGVTFAREKWTLKYDYPFEPQGKHMTHVWLNEQGESVLAMKGAVEGVLEHCKVDEIDRRNILDSVTRLASEGKRILGLASSKRLFSGNRVEDEKGASFIGLLVFSDPVRSSAKQAISDCQSAGIEIKMLTGDHLLTAHAIADELKISHSENSIFSGSQLLEMDQEQRTRAYVQGAIFARVTPEQKYEMVKTLKSHNKVVAMTGDGVNDSPALKLADIGVSMGENATDVARSTAKMILLKNDFNGVVHAILEGRNIFSNLRRSFSYLIAFHIPVVLLAFIPPLLGWSQLMLPVHIILLELIVHPISAFAFENLKSQSHHARRSLIPTSTAITAGVSGLLLSVLSLLPMMDLNAQSDLNHIRSLVLVTVLFGNIGFTFVEAWPNYRSLKVTLIIGILAVLPFALCNLNIFREIFHLSPISNLELAKALVFGVIASIPSFLYRLSLFNKVYHRRL
ncbi:MAG: cation-transporting P-type ATPase [Bdellovibrionaceae bacterium]|nr:cation-transporting P-type ATPase [Pseudobdellovibrionaceae bacterium]